MLSATVFLTKLSDRDDQTFRQGIATGSLGEKIAQCSAAQRQLQLIGGNYLNRSLIGFNCRPETEEQVSIRILLSFRQNYFQRLLLMNVYITGQNSSKKYNKALKVLSLVLIRASPSFNT